MGEQPAPTEYYNDDDEQDDRTATTGRVCEGTMLTQTSCLKSKNLWRRLRWCFREDHNGHCCAAGEGVPGLLISVLLSSARQPLLMVTSRTCQHLVVVSLVYFVMNPKFLSLLITVLLSLKMSASSFHKTNLTYVRPI
jgi:hypothetical protein